MVLWALADPRRVILTFSFHRAKQIKEQFGEQFPDIVHRVFDFEEFRRVREGRYRHDECVIGIDDLDILLSHWLRFPVRRVSFSISGESDDILGRNSWHSRYQLLPDFGALQPYGKAPKQENFERFYEAEFEGEKKGFKKPKKKK